MLKLVLIPPQGFGSEAKTRGGILGAPANKKLQNEYTVHIPEKKTQFVQTVGSLTSRCSGKWACARGKSSLFNGVAE